MISGTGPGRAPGAPVPDQRGNHRDRVTGCQHVTRLGVVEGAVGEVRRPDRGRADLRGPGAERFGEPAGGPGQPGQGGQRGGEAGGGDHGRNQTGDAARRLTAHPTSVTQRGVGSSVRPLEGAHLGRSGAIRRCSVQPGGAARPLSVRMVHLKPPSSAGPIWMERFSPIFSDCEAFKLKWNVAHRNGVIRMCIPRWSISRRSLTSSITNSKTRYLRARMPASIRQFVIGLRPGRRTTCPSSSTGPRLGSCRSTTVGISVRRAPTRSQAQSRRSISPAPIVRSAPAARTWSGTQIELSVAGGARIVISEFARRGLMFVDGTLALSLGLPAVGGR